MSDIPWSREASLLRRTGAGMAEEARGTLHQLVGAFIELPPEQQQGLILRTAGPEGALEYQEAEIRELAAKPEFTGAESRWDSDKDRDEPDFGEAPDETAVEEGVSGPARG
ncbi:MAG: hypothetical protein M3N07_02950 [Pseudomonadota bacterium]|nr:hypothetical protein [Pseudomonadota bacterium]